MVALISGVAALLFGIIALISWWDEFIWLLKGIIPLTFIFGGTLAAYLGAEEVKDKRRADLESTREPFIPVAEDIEKYKQEVAELKSKLASMENFKEDQ